MFQINHGEFGAFLAMLRKEKSMTQKELAQKLFISDKAVSKWERGLSMPDISLLLPLGEILGVTTTELLSCKRMETCNELSIEQVETLVTKTIDLSNEEHIKQTQHRFLSSTIFVASIIIVALELLLLYSFGYTTTQLKDNLLTIELLLLIFGTWFCFFARQTLPSYYDEHKICTYSDGIFKMNIPGIHFNNSNWPFIVRTAQITTMALFTVFPLLYLGISWLYPALWEAWYLFFSLGLLLSMFLPLYIVGKRYE